MPTALMELSYSDKINDNISLIAFADYSRFTTSLELWIIPRLLST